MRHTKPRLTPVALSLTSALTRVVDLAVKGYAYYCTGQCPAAKLQHVANKFHQLYGIGCSPAQRLTRKEHGLANVSLVIYCDAQYLQWITARASGQPADGATADLEAEDEQEPLSAHNVDWDKLPKQSMVYWALLVTEGTGAVHEQENLKPVAGQEPLTFCGYQLTRHNDQGRISWTFKREDAVMEALYTVLNHQLKHRQHAQVAQTLLRMSRQPGFHGVREQSKAMQRHALQHGYTGELPALRYTQKVSHGIPLRLKCIEDTAEDARDIRK